MWKTWGLQFSKKNEEFHFGYFKFEMSIKHISYISSSVYKSETQEKALGGRYKIKSYQPLEINELFRESIHKEVNRMYETR